MRAALAAMVCWVGALGFEVWLGARLLESEVVAGLISPQGATLSGLLAVLAFVAVRLLAVLALPSLVAALITWTLLSWSARPPAG